MRKNKIINACIANRKMEIIFVHCEACPNTVKIPEDSWSFPGVSKAVFHNGIPCLWDKCQIKNCGRENLFNLFDLTSGIETTVKVD